MFKRIGFILLAISILSGCQSISDEELEVLNARADKADQLQLENSQLKQGHDTLMQTVDELSLQLEQEISDKQVLIEKMDNGGMIKVTMQQDILFSSSSFEIDQEGAANILNKVVASIVSGESTPKLIIVGHSDNLPVAQKWRSHFSDNWDLSSRRAGEVARYLIWGANFPRENIAVVGRADVEPVASNDTKEGRAQNRRIELLIKK
jgi:flagellar motor protein MotB